VSGLDLLTSRMRNAALGAKGKSTNQTKPAHATVSTQQYDGVKDMWVLGDRPKHAKNILEEFNVTIENPLRLIIYQHQSPGDILMLTATLSDIHAQYPGLFVTDVRVPSMELFSSRSTREGRCHMGGCLPIN